MSSRSRGRKGGKKKAQKKAQQKLWSRTRKALSKSSRHGAPTPGRASSQGES